MAGAKMFSYLGFKSVRSLAQVFDAFCKGLCAYSVENGWQRESKSKAAQFETCAHVFNILWKARKIELEGARLGNFMLKHDDFVHPRIIFEPNTTLMAISEDSVLFAQCDVDVHAHETGPFFYINQFNHVRRLIRIPVRHFVSLMRDEGAARVREDELNLVLLSNVGRCGSTLLTQMFEKFPETVSISEPECLMPFAADPDLFTPGSRGKDNKTGSGEGFGFTRSEALRACVMALVVSCNNSGGARGGRKRNIVIKPKAHAIAITRELDEVFKGRMRHLYLYRHPSEYVTSVSTVFNSLLHPVVRTAVMRFSIRMGMEAFVMTHFADRDSPRAAAMRTFMGKVDMGRSSYRFAAMFAANVMSMVEHREEGGLDVKFLSYHELVQDPEGVMAGVSQFCGMAAGNGADPHDEAESKEATLEVSLPEGDSQNKSGLSRQHLNNYKKSLDDAKIREIDAVLNNFHLPSCQEFPIDARGFVQVLQDV